jgi:hypothetical protein
VSAKLLHYGRLQELYCLAVIVDRSGNCRISLLGGPGFMPRHREGYTMLTRAINRLGS